MKTFEILLKVIVTAESGNHASHEVGKVLLQKGWGIKIGSISEVIKPVTEHDIDRKEGRL